MKKTTLTSHLLPTLAIAVLGSTASIPQTASAQSDNLTIVSATSTDTHDADFNPSRTIDGDLDNESRWSSKGDNQKLTLDLGSVQEVNEIRLVWYRGNEREAYFDVETSTNASDWQTVLSNATSSGSGEQSFPFENSDARYVRIVGKGNSSSEWNSIIEAQLLNTDSDQPELACTSFDNLRIAEASSDDSHDGTNSPSRAIDNNIHPTSRWSSDGIGNSIVLDLGRTSTVRRVSTEWYETENRASFFEVQTSLDDSNYQTVGSQLTVPRQNQQSAVTVEVNESEARYVRIVGLGNSNNSFNSLIEVDVLGCGTVDNSSPVSTDLGGGDDDGGTGGGSTTTADTPSDILSYFRSWNLTLGDGSTESNLIDYENDDYFYTVNDGVDWVVYRSANSDGTTPNSSNSRSELRQLQEWTPEDGGRMTGTLKVMHVSTSADARFSPSFSTIVGQIHSSEGHENEPLKIFYKKFPGHTKGSVSWNYEINTAGDNSGRWDFNTAVWGDDWSVVGQSRTDYPPEPADGIELGEEFSYIVDVSNGIMRLTFESDGHPTRTFTKNLINSEFTQSSDIPAQVQSTFVPIGQDGTERSNAYAGELQYFRQGSYNQTNGKAPEDVGTGGTTFWNTDGDTFGGDIDEQYANGAYAEVWFRAGTVASGNDMPGLVNGGFESGLNGWVQDEPASESGVSFNGVNAAKVEADGGISQTVLVLPGEDYTLSAMLRSESSGSSASVRVGNQTIDIPIPDGGDYERTSVEFNSGNNEEITITFSSSGVLRIDDVELDGDFPALE